MEKLDKIDRKILNLLQQNAKIQLKVLAERVFLSSPATSARLERLSQLICGYQARLDLVQLGFHVTAFINLEVDPRDKPTFYPFIKACPNVLECNCVTGPFSMLIKVAFPSTVELDDFINVLQKFGKTSTQIVFSTSVEPRGILLPAED
ncbi:MAG: Lrp/AsnC family transcriptional regulator [Christensenellaceae bacterium]|jgi:Lrp/AsnC family leucine-responsive transcriptional regulator|nr:Lrp/AsnC family transcriptional regulator [Christensenellaceae bacterium]